MTEKEKNMLEHAFLNQLQTDIESGDYEAFSEMMQELFKNSDNQEIILDFLSDSCKESFKEGKTIMRY